MGERRRELVGPVGVLPPGRGNAIPDVPGVRIGHARADPYAAAYEAGQEAVYSCLPAAREERC